MERVSPTISETPLEEPATQPDEAVLCAACAHALTHRSKAIDVGGAHEHTFRNPAGYSYHVLCYTEASGSHRVGIPASEASWFAGYDWCFAICGQCHEHVGWWYVPREKEKTSFAGLIATRLIRSR